MREEEEGITRDKSLEVKPHGVTSESPFADLKGFDYTLDGVKGLCFLRYKINIERRGPGEQMCSQAS